MGERGIRAIHARAAPRPQTIRPPTRAIAPANQIYSATATNRMEGLPDVERRRRVSSAHAAARRRWRLRLRLASWEARAALLVGVLVKLPRATARVAARLRGTRRWRSFRDRRHRLRA